MKKCIILKLEKNKEGEIRMNYHYEDNSKGGSRCISEGDKNIILGIINKYASQKGGIPKKDFQNFALD